MSFYGKPNNITETHFQFDKFYPNRQAMDADLINGQDNIFTGRFVLVNYNDADILSLPSVQIGYKFVVSGTTYFCQDFTGEQPFVHTDFISFEQANIPDPPSADTYLNYYFKKDNYFFKMPTDPSYYIPENRQYYYIPENTESSAIIGTGWILRECSGTTFTGDFYRCTGAEEGTNVPTWQRLTSADSYVFSYLNNYNIDRDAYGSNFDERGYNATVWQKVYSDGVGRFVLVARLECVPPKIELVQDPPSTDPSAPYLDAKSTDQLYRIHVPTHWGVQVKPAENQSPSGLDDDDDEDGVEPYYLSDQLIIRPDGTSYLADIYLNLGGISLPEQQRYHMASSHKDLVTKNEVLLTPSGKSGTLYDGELRSDLLELSVHLPSVGNMIDDGYDLMYGSKEVVDSETGTINVVRPRDIQWYNGDNWTLKNTGNQAIGGKTYDLNTLAGTLNTMHTRLGQIIVSVATRPDASNIPEYSSDYIYYIEDEDKYFRIGQQYTYTELTNADYSFNPVSLDDIEYTTDTYYYKDDQNTYQISVGITDPNNPPQLYEKSVQGEMFHPVEPALIGYQPGQYYLKRSSDYICDQGHQPSSPESQYYTIDPNEDLTVFPGSEFGGQYMPGLYRYLDENSNYLRDMGDLPTAGREYYSVNIDGTASLPYSEVLLYMKNKFYYKDNAGKYLPCTYETVQEARSYLGNNSELYWLEFDESIEIITSYENNGVIETVIGHPLKEAHGGLYLFDMVDPPQDTNNFYQVVGSAEDYIAFQNLNYNIKNENGTPTYATKATYVILSSVALQSNLYVTGKYYYKDSSNSYLISYDNLDRQETYYIINSVSKVTNPFYLPGVYYYQSSPNFFEIDMGDRITTPRIYYNKDRLFVIEDYTGRCPYGYEWNNYSVFIPASITLGRREESLQFIEMKNFSDGLHGSINGHLLQLEKYLEIDNEDIRDKSTFKGALNLLQDYLYTLGRLVPRQVLYVNDFGQIASSGISYSQLKNIMSKYDEIMSL